MRFAGVTNKNDGKEVKNINLVTCNNLAAYSAHLPNVPLQPFSMGLLK